MLYYKMSKIVLKAATSASSSTTSLQVGDSTNSSNALNTTELLTDYKNNKPVFIELNDTNITVDNNNYINHTTTESTELFFIPGTNYNPISIFNPGDNTGTSITKVSVRKSTGDVYVSGKLKVINNTNFDSDPNMPKSNNIADGCKLAKYNPSTKVWSPIFIPRDLFLNVSDRFVHNNCKSVLNNTTNIVYLLLDFKGGATNDAGWNMLVRYDLTTNTFSYVCENFSVYDYSHSTATYNASIATYGGNIKTFSNGNKIGELLIDKASGNGVLYTDMHIDETTNKLYLVVPAYKAPNNQRQVIIIDENQGGYITTSSALTGVNNYRGSKLVNNKIFIYGSGDNDLYIYDISSDTWTQFSTPSGHGVNDIVFINNNSFYIATYSGGPRFFAHYKTGSVIGGSVDYQNGYVNDAGNGYIYSILNNLPLADNNLDNIYVTGLLYMNNLIYICASNSTKQYKYNLTTKTFSLLNNSGRSGDSIFNIDSAIYIIGGSVIFGYGVINGEHKLKIMYHPSTGSDKQLVDYNTEFNTKNFYYHIKLTKINDTIYKLLDEKLPLTKL